MAGIGASAGVLEELEQFFTHMPAYNGMAFIFISHQDPNQTSLLPETLQRYTEMPVVQVTEGVVEARRNTVYIKPSDSDLAVLQGSLTFSDPPGRELIWLSISPSGILQRTRTERRWGHRPTRHGKRRDAWNPGL